MHCLREEQSSADRRQCWFVWIQRSVLPTASNWFNTSNPLKTPAHPPTHWQIHSWIQLHLQKLLSDCVYLGQNLDDVKEGQVSQHMCLIIHLPNTFWFLWCTWQGAHSVTHLCVTPALYCSCYFLFFQQPPTDLFLTSLVAELPLAGAAEGWKLMVKDTLHTKS